MPSPEHILLMRFSSVGDVLLATPVAATLRRMYPQARISWLADAAYLDLIRFNPAIDRAVAFEYTARHRGPSGIRRLAKHLEPVDLVVDLQHKLRSVLLTAYLRPARRQVMIKRRGFGLVRAMVGHDAILRAPHQVERYLSVLNHGACGDDLPHPVLRVDPKVQDEIQDSFPVPQSGPVVGIIAGTRHPTKRWPVRHMAKLVERCQSRGLHAVLLGADEEAAVAHSVAECAGLAPSLVCTGGDLARLAGLIAQCDLVVSPDTGPAHMAAALGVAVVVLFGPTSPERWAPRGPGKVEVLRLDLPCSPCSNHGGSTCPVGTQECMQGLTADRVWQVVAQTLDPGSR